MEVGKWYKNPWLLGFIWILAGILTGWKQYMLTGEHSFVNNFVIFKSSFGHFAHHLPLYLEYHKEYFDLYLYGPVFAILMAPFAVLPLGISVVMWNVLNAGLLFWALMELPLGISKKSGILWIVLNSLLTALLNTQFHAICISMIIWSYIFVQRGRDFWSASLIVLGILIKFYGIVGLAFFFFSKDRWRFAGYLVFWLVVWGLLPFMLGGMTYGWRCYGEWLAILQHKNELNVDISNFRTDVCVMGMFRRITGDGTLSNLWFLVPSMLLNIWVYFQPKKWGDLVFQLRMLAFVSIYLMLASTGTESPTLVMAMPGLGIWFMLSEQKRWQWVLLVITLLISSFSPTDLFPKFLREGYIIRYGLMILPLLGVWLALAVDLLRGKRPL
ncbi:MAG: hypothetical protein RL246_1227 [Bacteroidota bacterium]